EISLEREPGGHVIAVGNMANNAFVRACYHRYLCLTDRAYPGPGVWDVRTIHAPWAGMRSVVLCGASDDAGQMLAVDRLVELARANRGELGATIDVRPGSGWEATLAEADAFEA